MGKFQTIQTILACGRCLILASAVFVSPVRADSVDPKLELRWLSAQLGALRATISVDEARVRSCTDSGVAFGMRLTVDACPSEWLWFGSSCDRRRVDVRINREPIQDTFFVTRDILEDKNQPHVSIEEHMEAALRKAREQTLSIPDLRLPKDTAVLRVRGTGGCRVSGGISWDLIPTFLTFGLVSFGDRASFDTGTVAFSLHSANAAVGAKGK